MHLVGPALTTTGKKKGKKKFRNADVANQARKNAENWKNLLEKYDVKMVVGKSKSSRKGSSKGLDSYRADWTSRIDPSRLTSHLPSVDTGVGIAAKAPEKVYTGTKVKGIGTMHKSNAVPIFSNEEAVDISTMRR